MSDANGRALKEAIENQGKLLVRRAEWLQAMIERQTQSILNHQNSIDNFQQELKATNLAIDALREEHRKLVGNGDDG